jgi:hypothetical protein
MRQHIDLLESNCHLTRHASQRAAQRGLSQQLLEFMLTNADIEVPARGGCTALRLSRSAAIGLAAELIVPIDFIYRALGTELIIGQETAVVTAYRIDRRRRSHRRSRWCGRGH